MGVTSANCSAEEMNLVLEGHFAVEFALVRKDNHTHVIGGKVSSVAQKMHTPKDYVSCLQAAGLSHTS